MNLAWFWCVKVKTLETGQGIFRVGSFVVIAHIVDCYPMEIDLTILC